MTLEAIERGERRVLIDYDDTHDYPSDWDDIWGSVYTKRDAWLGGAPSGAEYARDAWGFDDGRAVRYLRAFHDVLVTEIEWDHRGEWGWVFTERTPGESVEDWERRHTGNVDVWTTYLSGDVYRVTLQEKVAWRRVDGDDDDVLETWEFLDAMGGVAPFDYAMSMAEATLDSGDDEITYP